jgi:hypothetical protein
MDRFADLKAKYQSVIDAIPQIGIKLENLHLQDNKLFIRGAAPNQDIKNDIWNKIKAIDPTYSDLTCDIRIDPSLPVPAQAAAAAAGASRAPQMQTYVVQAGDSLWKIAQQYYGNGSLFKKIIDANPDKLKDEKSVIHPGDQLKIPAA